MTNKFKLIPFPLVDYAKSVKVALVKKGSLIPALLKFF